MPVTDESSLSTTKRIAYGVLGVAVLIAPLNFALFFVAINARGSAWLTGFFLLAFAQTVLGFAALVYGFVFAKRLREIGAARTRGFMVAAFGALASLGGVVGAFLGVVALAAAAGGGAWGRPLRIRGRVRHPELRRGDDWTRGDRPVPTGLDAATCEALELLWLHDAQKEHASVPAFSRVAWMLAAVGAPAELLERTFLAGQDEIEHTRLCFALAAGYGGRSHAVEPMPELLAGALDVAGNALVHLAVESLKDGCLLEDYNADVAAECAVACEEPVTRAVLERIAIEERAHAELSWSIVAWCLARGGDEVLRAVEQAREELRVYERPTAVSAEKRATVERADPAALRAHGRLPDTEWARMYDARLSAALARVDGMLEAAQVEKSAVAA